MAKEREDREHEKAMGQAPGIVERFIGRMFNQAHEDLNKEKHDDGCGCHTCKNRAVRNANQWADTAAGGYTSNPITHRINRKGKIVTRPNDDYEHTGARHYEEEE